MLHLVSAVVVKSLKCFLKYPSISSLMAGSTVAEYCNKLMISVVLKVLLFDSENDEGVQKEMHAQALRP